MCISHTFLPSLQMSPLLKMTYYHNKINNCSDSRALFKTFSSLLCPPPPPPSSTLTADDFATFFTNKTKTISDQFLTPQTNNNFITTNTQSLTSFSPLSETEVSKLILFQSSHYLSARSYPHSPPSSHFFFGHTCAYSHYQHLASHWYISHSI